MGDVTWGLFRNEALYTMARRAARPYRGRTYTTLADVGEAADRIMAIAEALFGWMRAEGE